MLRDIYVRITGGDFGESEVHSLISLLREDSPTRSVLDELGDLLAHRRRTEGRIHEYMRRVKEQAERFLRTGGIPPQPELIFSETYRQRGVSAQALGMALTAPLKACAFAQRV